MVDMFDYVCGFQVDVLSWFTWATLIFAWQTSPTTGSAKNPEASGRAISDLTARAEVQNGNDIRRQSLAPWGGLTSPTKIVALRLSG